MPIRNSKLIFIVACPRSGSTKLAALLDAHPQITSLPETHYFNYLAKQKAFFKNSEFQMQNLDLFLDEPRITDFLRAVNLSQTELADFIKQHAPLNTKSLFDLLLSIWAKKKSAEYLCEKTPQHLSCVEEIRKLYPEAKFIYLQRDGRDVVNSLLQMPWRPDGLWANARYWQRYLRLAEAAKKNLGSDNFLQIKFEDLAKNTVVVMQEISSFIGVEYAAVSIESSSNKIFANWEVEWKYKSRLEMDSSRIGAWQQELDPRQQKLLQWFIGSDLKKLAYV